MTGKQLFERPPRRKRRVMMHVIDAGNGAGGGKVIRFRCVCGHDTGRIVDDRTVAENKRGMPCPHCNKPEAA